MAMRVDETVSGVKADLAIKIFGDDFNALDSLSQQVLRAVSSVRGAAEPQIVLTSGVAELSVRVDRDALARYGLNVTDIEASVEAAASGSVVSRCFRNHRWAEKIHGRSAFAGTLPLESRSDRQRYAPRTKW